MEYNLFPFTFIMMIPFRILPLSEEALSVQFEGSLLSAHAQVMQLDALLNTNPFVGFLESVPAYVTLTIYYDTFLLKDKGSSPFQVIKNQLVSLLKELPSTESYASRLIEIPVCYEGDFAPDINEVATHIGLTKEELILRHTAQTYQVSMMGFLPGFAYLTGLDERLACPRKASPRLQIPAGSVGIAGLQTGVYPLDSPGGWQLIGRTPLTLFSPEKEKPFLLEANDQIRFYAISEEAFYRIQALQTPLVEAKNVSRNGGIQVLKAGIYATIQDLGRKKYQRFGVPISGAMDTKALLEANYLCGNQPTMPVIEATMGGLSLLFHETAHIALTGAGVATLNGVPCPFYQTIKISKSDQLTILFNGQGYRSYLAVRGGFLTTQRMHSASTYPKAGLGSSLKKEDSLSIGKAEGNLLSRRSLPIRYVANQVLIRVLQGQEFEWMEAESQAVLFTKSFSVTHQSDRMGYRLAGTPLHLANTTQLLSTAVTKGTIQLTPKGELIILMSDAQTCGGYPRVGQVIWSDLSLLAQLKPQDTLQFVPISFNLAEQIYLNEHQRFHELFD